MCGYEIQWRAWLWRGCTIAEAREERKSSAFALSSSLSPCPPTTLASLPLTHMCISQVPVSYAGRRPARLTALDRPTTPARGFELDLLLAALDRSYVAHWLNRTQVSLRIETLSMSRARRMQSQLRGTRFEKKVRSSSHIYPPAPDI